MHISSIYLKHQVHEMFPLCRLIQPIWRSRFVHFFKLIHKQPFTPLTYRKGSEWQEFTVVHHHRCVSVYVNYWTDCIYCFMKHSLASSDISLILHLHSVLFKLGESVHLTSSVPGNQSAFFHPLIAVTMTTDLITRNSVPDDESVNRRRGVTTAGTAVEMRKGDSGKKKTKPPPTHLHLKGRSLDFPLWHTNDQQGCMILTESFENSVQFSILPSLSLSLFFFVFNNLQSSSVVTLPRNKNRAPKTAHEPDWRLCDDFNCDLRWKYKVTLALRDRDTDLLVCRPR